MTTSGLANETPMKVEEAGLAMTVVLEGLRFRI